MATDPPPPLYNLIRGSLYDSRRREQIEAYLIDRRPQGPLGELAQMQDGRTACDPCLGIVAPQRAGVPLRYALRLPDAVKRAYVSGLTTDYLDRHTLPGFLTWLGETGYRLVDMRHALPLEHGLWLEYCGSSASEFTSAEAPNPVARTAPCTRAGVCQYRRRRR